MSDFASIASYEVLKNGEVLNAPLHPLLYVLVLHRVHVFNIALGSFRFLACCLGYLQGRLIGHQLHDGAAQQAVINQVYKNRYQICVCCNSKHLESQKYLLSVLPGHLRRHVRT